MTVATSRAMALNTVPSFRNSVGANRDGWGTRDSRLPSAMSRAVLITASTGRTSSPDSNQLRTVATKRPKTMRASAMRLTSLARTSSSSIGCGTITPQPVLGTVVKPVIMSFLTAGE